MEESVEQTNNRPWLYKKGQSGNPNGRPVGSKTLKTYLAEKFRAMTDDERETFLEGIDKKTMWEMAEDKAQSKTDLTTLGKALPTPIINVVQPNLSNEQDTKAE